MAAEKDGRLRMMLNWLGFIRHCTPFALRSSLVCGFKTRSGKLPRSGFPGCHAALLLLLLALVGCATYEGEAGYPDHPHPPGSVYIPKGHLPPPGQCRIWFPGVPPGQQPPPDDCHELERRVPPDAILVRG